MDWLSVIRTFAAITTVIAAILVAANWSPKFTVAGFVIFIVASLAWIADGWTEDKASLVIQNVILFWVNIAGVYRWLPRAQAQTEH